MSAESLWTLGEFRELTKDLPDDAALELVLTTADGQRLPARGLGSINNENKVQIEFETVD